MGELTQLMHIRDTPGAAAVWARLDKDAKRFVLREVGEQKVTEALVKEAVKKWRKQQRKKKKTQ